ncbi:hypothetical protein O9G_004565 [Rozella allomycis CSF55]|uniref:Uncharacterized protein n=1 Tax=Rozella allomycis (strain CSF55) TaxID=988480 RepID=A0A075AQX1_ROZAC|nr:hypothetical protein O9G_004565 [Rozella allomycis CSF55]|eukprot:EPZ32613.1 hypothetical protein O9G_004565 [Rozella allomycis CSF55]
MDLFKNPPANEGLNAIARQYFKRALNEANMRFNKTKKCHAKDIDDAFRHEVRNKKIAGVIDTIESLMEVEIKSGNYTTDTGQKKSFEFRVAPKNHIYSNFSSLAYPILNTPSTFGTIFYFHTTDNVKTIIGADKIGHFFETSIDFFEKGKEKFNKLIRTNMTAPAALFFAVKMVVEESEKTEDGLFGIGTGLGKYMRIGSGVKSYADLACNYKGAVFWTELTSEHSFGEIDRKNKKPYYECDDDNGWKQIREFNFEDYINAGWDEGINPNTYKLPESLEEIKKIVKSLYLEGKTESPHFPLNKQACVDAMKYYPKVFVEKIFSPLCFD